LRLQQYFVESPIKTDEEELPSLVQARAFAHSDWILHIDRESGKGTWGNALGSCWARPLKNLTLSSDNSNRPSQVQPNRIWHSSSPALVFQRENGTTHHPVCYWADIYGPRYMYITNLCCHIFIYPEVWFTLLSRSLQLVIKDQTCSLKRNLANSFLWTYPCSVIPVNSRSNNCTTHPSLHLTPPSPPTIACLNKLAFSTMLPCCAPPQNAIAKFKIPANLGLKHGDYVSFSGKLTGLDQHGVPTLQCNPEDISKITPPSPASHDLITPIDPNRTYVQGLGIVMKREELRTEPPAKNPPIMFTVKHTLEGDQAVSEIRYI
jgi:hypothetical protein